MESVETASCVSRVLSEGIVVDAADGRAHSGVPGSTAVPLDAAASIARGRPFGILCATWGETIPFLERMRVHREVRRGPRSFFEGELGGCDVVVTCAGVGKVNAAMGVQQLVDAYPVWGVANVGTAGAADSALELFDIVIAVECVHYDVPESVLPDSYPFYPAEVFESDADLLEAARRASGAWPRPFAFGRIATGECFVDDSNRGAIVDAFAPLAVDMETAAMAQACFANRIPFIAMRCITDTPAFSGYDGYAENAEEASGYACGAAALMLESLSESG